VVVDQAGGQVVLVPTHGSMKDRTCFVQGSGREDSVGHGDACPIFPGKHYLDWEREDPAGQGVEAVRLIHRVQALIAELLPHGDTAPVMSSRPIQPAVKPGRSAS